MSLRITSPSNKRYSLRRGPEGYLESSGNGAVEQDFYMSRLIKLIPAEAIAIYPLLLSRAREAAKSEPSTGVSAAADATQTGSDVSSSLVGAVNQTANSLSASGTNELASQTAWLMPAMAWMVLLMVILLRWQATRDEDGNPQWGAVAIAAISFFLWVPTINEEAFGVIDFMTRMGLIGWTPEIEKFILEILLMFWTLLVPAFYRPEK